MKTRRRSHRRVRRRVRRNPPRISASTRRKISRSLRRRNRPAIRRRRRAPVAVIRRRRRSRPILALARRSPRRLRRLARRSFRRRGRSTGGGSAISSLKSLVSRDTLMMAGGAVGAAFITNWVLTKYGQSLPGYIDSTTGQESKIGIAYRVAIPVLAAFVVGKYLKQRKLAEGMVIGGAIIAINKALELVQSKVAGTGEYFDRPAAVGALPPGYSAVQTFQAPPGVYQSESAFANSAW